MIVSNKSEAASIWCQSYRAIGVFNQFPWRTAQRRNLIKQAYVLFVDNDVVNIISIRRKRKTVIINLTRRDQLHVTGSRDLSYPKTLLIRFLHHISNVFS